MKSLLVQSTIALIAITSGIGYAAESKDIDRDIEIVSVIPRSPDVKPLALSVPPDGHHMTAAPVSPTVDGLLDHGTAKVVAADHRKAAPAAHSSYER